MKVAIRTNASSEIGLGHLMRCMTLATMLKSSRPNISVTFWLNEDAPASLDKQLSLEGFSIVRLKGCPSTHPNHIKDADACAELLLNQPILELIIVGH